MSRLRDFLKSWPRPIVRRFVGPYVDKRVLVALDEREEFKEMLAEVPVLLSQRSSFAAAQRQAKREHEALKARVDDIQQRLESFRHETLIGASPRRGPTAPQSDSRISNPAKLDAAGENIRLNLGCGHALLPEYINVDSRDLPGVDVVADVRALPFEASSVAEIRSIHFLEHFTNDELTRSLLPYWYSLLRPGGTFSVVVPDTETMIGEYLAGNVTFQDLRRFTYGDQEEMGDFKVNMFSTQSICTLLQEAGFGDVSVVAAGRRKGVCYEMEVQATKPVRRSSAERARDHGSRS